MNYFRWVNIGMLASTISYEETMSDAEFSFLQEKAIKEKRLLVRIIRNLSVIFIIIPCCIGIIMESLRRQELSPYMKAIENERDPYFARNYVIFMLILLALVAVFSGLYYFRTLWKLQKDIQRNLKTIEQTNIERKQYISTNESYHFYLDSPNQLSIEVSKPDFERFEEGDEINIEYSTYSKVYFGYF